MPAFLQSAWFHETEHLLLASLSVKARALQPVATLLVQLAELGFSRAQLATLVRFTLSVPKASLRFLAGPTVQYPSPWCRHTPAWLPAAVPPERVALIVEESGQKASGWRVGPAELATYLYPATLDSPLSDPYAQLYLWASTKAVARRTGKSVHEVYAQLGLTPIPDAEVTQASGEYFNSYRRLATSIRHFVVQAGRGRGHVRPTGRRIPP